jgi:hypothetical protein
MEQTGGHCVKWNKALTEKYVESKAVDIIEVKKGTVATRGQGTWGDGEELVSGYYVTVRQGEEDLVCCCTVWWL